MTVVTAHGRVISRVKSRVLSVLARLLRSGIRCVVGGTSIVSGSCWIIPNTGPLAASVTELDHKFFFAQRNYTFTHKHTLFAHIFNLCPDHPKSFPRPSQSLPSPLRSQGLRQLRGPRAVETHRFRWKEIDIFFTIAVSLSCHGERNRWPIITEAVSHGLAEVQLFHATFSSS